MTSRSHIIAVNRTIRSGGLNEAGSAAAVIDLARNLARRMDAVGADNAPMSLVNAYQSAVARLQREVAAKRGRNRVEAGRDADDDTAPENALEAFKRRWRVGPMYQ